MGTDLVEMLPNRSRMSIRQRARTLSLCAKMGRKPAKTWKPEESAMVRDLYPIYGEKLVDYLVGKSAEDVNAQARKLGVLIGKAANAA